MQPFLVMVDLLDGPPFHELGLQLLFVLFSEFSDLDEVCCSGSDGHIAATNQLPVYDVCLVGPFASTFAAFLCNLFFILTVLWL